MELCDKFRKLRAASWSGATRSEEIMQQDGAVRRVERTSKDFVQQDRMVTHPVGFLQQDGAM
jgi:hypothetical protein